MSNLKALILWSPWENTDIRLVLKQDLNLKEGDELVFHHFPEGVIEVILKERKVNGEEGKDVS